MKGFGKLFSSSTFLAGLFANIAGAIQFGGLDKNLLIATVAGYAVKEAAAKFAPAPTAQPAQ